MLIFVVVSEPQEVLRSVEHGRAATEKLYVPEAEGVNPITLV